MLKTTQRITIDLATMNAFTAGAKLKNTEGVVAVSVVTFKQIRVRFKPKKVSAETILSAVEGTAVDN